LYTYERFKREKLLAEANVMFAKVNLDEDMCKIVPLERPYVRLISFSLSFFSLFESIFSHHKIQTLAVVLILNRIHSVKPVK